jgi:hypothetical protein
VGHWQPSQDLTMRDIGVEASGGVEDDGLRVAAGSCPRVIDRSISPDLGQGRLDAPKSKLLASTCSTASLSHW